MAKKITLPLTKELAQTLRAGDEVLLTGTIYTSRDAGHKRMCEALARGEKLPFDAEAIIFIISVDLPHPGSPWISVSFPRGIYGYHSQSTDVSVTLLYSFSCPEHKSIIFRVLSAEKLSVVHSFSAPQ